VYCSLVYLRCHAADTLTSRARCADLLLSDAADVMARRLEVEVEEGGWEEGCVDVVEVL
jgi:hypothetical protein